MNLDLDPYKLQRLLDDAAELAVKKYRMERGEEKRFISENKAVSIYGSVVKRWIQEKLITYAQDGPKSMKRLDAYKLESLSKQANRITYLTVKERKEITTK